MPSTLREATVAKKKASKKSQGRVAIVVAVAVAIVLAVIVTVGTFSANRSKAGAGAISQELVAKNNAITADSMALIFNYVYKDGASGEEAEALKQLERFQKGEIRIAVDPQRKDGRIAYSPDGPTNQPCFVFPLMEIGKMYGSEMFALVLMEEAFHASENERGLTGPNDKGPEKVECEVRAARVTTQFWERVTRLGYVPTTFVSEQDAAEVAGCNDLVRLWQTDKSAWEQYVRGIASTAYDAEGNLAPLNTP